MAPSDTDVEEPLVLPATGHLARAWRPLEARAISSGGEIAPRPRLMQVPMAWPRAQLSQAPVTVRTRTTGTFRLFNLLVWGRLALADHPVPAVSSRDDVAPCQTTASGITPVNCWDHRSPGREPCCQPPPPGWVAAAVVEAPRGHGKSARSSSFGFSVGTCSAGSIPALRSGDLIQN